MSCFSVMFRKQGIINEFQIIRGKTYLWFYTEYKYLTFWKQCIAVPVPRCNRMLSRADPEVNKWTGNSMKAILSFDNLPFVQLGNKFYLLFNLKFMMTYSFLVLHFFDDFQLVMNFCCPGFFGFLEYLMFAPHASVTKKYNLVLA